MKIPSLKSQFLVMSGVLMITLAALTLWLSGFFFNHFSKDIARRNLNLCRVLAEHTEYLLSRPVHELSKVLDMVNFQPYESQYDIQDELDDILRFNPFFELIQVMDLNGTITHVAPYKLEHIGLDMSNHPFFKAAVNRVAPIWSDSFISSQTDALAATVSIPFKHGVIMAQFNLRHLSSTLRSSALGEGGFAAITDTRGVIIAHSDKTILKKSMNVANLVAVQEGLDGAEGTWDEVWDKNPGLASVAIIDTNMWVVVVFQPDSQARAAIKQMELIALVVLALVFLMALMAQYFILKKVTAPLRKLETQSKMVAEGSYKEKIKPDYRELISLVDSFNTMSDRIRHREKELKESEEKYRAIFEGAKEGILLVEQQGRQVLFANQAMQQLLGISAKALQNSDLREFSPGDDEDIDKILARLASEKKNATQRIPFKNSAGSTRIMETSAAPVTLAGSAFIAAFFNDITHKLDMEAEKENLERQLLHTQKIEAIGVLAGGIAHDFNNILYPILGYAEMMQEDLPEDNPNYGKVSEIMTAALRARDLVSQILAFSRQSEKQVIPIRLQPIIKETVKLLRSSLPSTITVEMDIEEECGQVIADPTQIHQVIMNLTTNAFHAMQEKGGKLYIELKQTIPSSSLLALLELKHGAYAQLIVKDTGAGIRSEILDKIFDPYFTTKERGKGTGLGLSVVQGIVKNSRGNIRVESHQGKGTCITVFLPIPDEDENQTKQDKPRIDPGGTESILVVDDEESVVNMEKIMLERLGYNVTALTDSHDAFGFFSAWPERFDLIISDMTMPTMTGLELLKKVKSIRPDLPFIICTGFSDQVNQASHQKMNIQGYIEKPIVSSEMASVVRQVLDQSKKL